MGNLGTLYAIGNGVTQDFTKAIEWYQKAADAGNDEAMRNLGIVYTNGDGVSQNFTKAIEWYRKGADAGDTEAMVDVGLLYGGGYGVKKDHATAVTWYWKAAEAGWLNPYYLEGYWTSRNGMYTFELRQDGGYITTLPVVPYSGDTYVMDEGVIRDYFMKDPDKKTDQLRIAAVSENEIEVYVYQAKTSYTLFRRR